MNSFVLYVTKLICNFLPETRCFKLKSLLYRRAGAKIGKNVKICSSALIIGSGDLTIGDNTWIGHKSTLIASSKISIGANCDIAPKVFVGNGTHLITPGSCRIANEEVSKDTKIGNGCWVGVGAVILPGVMISDKCVIAAGSVVTKDVSEPLILVAGVPAVLKKRLIENV